MAQREKDLVVSSGAGLGAAVATESGGELGEVEAVRARGYWELVWIRFKRDKIALASIVFIVLMIAVAFGGAPLAKHYVGHGPNDIFTGTQAVETLSLLPANPWTHIDNIYTGKKNILVLGAANRLGQDEFLLLLFVIALAATVGPQLNSITLGIFPPGVITLVLIFSIFGWFYPARIMRAQVLSIREKEYVEAARMIGASDVRIIRSHVLPHLVAPIIVYSTLIVAGYVLFEAGLSFLGIGIPVSTPSWGNLLSTAPEFYTTRPLLMIWPGLAVMLTTLAFNLLGDGLRDAFDPRSSH